MFWVVNSFLLTLKKCVISFWLPMFLMKNLTFPPVGKMSLFNESFKNFFFNIRKFNYGVFDLSFFGCLLCEVHSASWICRFKYLPNLWIFQSLFLCVFFYPTSFFSSLQDSNDINVRSLIVVPQIPESTYLILVYLFNLFNKFRKFNFLFFRLDNFYCSIFQFTDSFLCLLHSTDEPIDWAFSFVIVFFSS